MDGWKSGGPGRERVPLCAGFKAERGGSSGASGSALQVGAPRESRRLTYFSLTHPPTPPASSFSHSSLLPTSVQRWRAGGETRISWGGPGRWPTGTAGSLVRRPSPDPGAAPPIPALHPRAPQPPQNSRSPQPRRSRQDTGRVPGRFAAHLSVWDVSALSTPSEPGSLGGRGVELQPQPQPGPGAG